MESCIAKDSCQPVEERYQTVDEDKLEPLKEFITLGGNGLLSSVFVIVCLAMRHFTKAQPWNEIKEDTRVKMDSRVGRRD